MSIVKKRLSPEESRSAALEAARHILIEMGPAAVTLKAVAARIDRTHANLLHHFGSAAGLQKALAAYQAETVCATIGRKMAESPPGERNVREIVDLAFDAFNSGGAGALATWMAEALGLPRDTSRVLATELINGRIAKFWAEHGGKPQA